MLPLATGHAWCALSESILDLGHQVRVIGELGGDVVSPSPDHTRGIESWSQSLSLHFNTSDIFIVE